MTQPETVLVLMPGNRTQREILFIRPPDARREHWNGHLLTPAEATAQTGHRDRPRDASLRPFFSDVMQQVPYGLKSREAAITDTEYDGFL